MKLVNKHLATIVCFFLFCAIFLLNRALNGSVEENRELNASKDLAYYSYHTPDTRTCAADDSLRGKFLRHKWPKRLVHESGNRMYFDSVIIESGHVFYHIRDYASEMDDGFKLEDRYSILNALLGNDLAKFYIKIVEETPISQDTHNRTFLNLYQIKLTEAISVDQLITNNLVYADAAKCAEAYESMTSDFDSDHAYVEQDNILSDLKCVILVLFNKYNATMHNLYRDLISLNNKLRDKKKVRPLELWNSAYGGGQDSSTHTEFLVVYKVLSETYSSRTEKRLTEVKPQDWTSEDKTAIAKRLSNGLLSRKAMCPTCETFLSCLSEHIFATGAPVPEEPGSRHDLDPHILFLYVIEGSDGKGSDPSSRLWQQRLVLSSEVSGSDEAAASKEMRNNAQKDGVKGKGK